VLADAAVFPRDKACGDGLTPRAVAELDRLGLGDWVRGRARNRGLRAAGFGQTLLLPWPGGSLPDHGGAVPRTELDARIRDVALADGAVPMEGAKAVDVERDGDRVSAVVFATDGGRRTVRCRSLVVADGARSPLGRLLGRQWHRDTAYGVAARGYVKSGRSDDEWISSHLELRGIDGELLSGYGWVFPLGAAAGEINIGVGTLATARRPAGVQLRVLMDAYAEARREEWQLEGPVRVPASALLPMGGAVSGVAGRNWALVGDAAGCVNPLNGEGIDYGLETGREVVGLLDDDLSAAWPTTLRRHYGEAFSIARRLAGLITVPRLLPAAGPVGMRSRALMTVALRVMGNLITEEDRDVVARAWRLAGRVSSRFDESPMFAA
jgi:menaquinone-9 beta-reductase